MFRGRSVVGIVYGLHSNGDYSDLDHTCPLVRLLYTSLEQGKLIGGRRGQLQPNPSPCDAKVE